MIVTLNQHQQWDALHDTNAGGVISLVMSTWFIFQVALSPFKQYRILTVELLTRVGAYDSSVHNSCESYGRVFCVELTAFLCAWDQLNQPDPVMRRLNPRSN